MGLVTWPVPRGATSRRLSGARGVWLSARVKYVWFVSSCVIGGAGLSACVGAAPAASTPPGAAAAPAPFTFDWSPPCRVPVVETTRKNGHEIGLAYWLDVQPEESGGVAVRRRSQEIVTLDGAPVRPAERRLAAGAMAEQWLVYPTLVVARDGQVARVDGVDAAIERVIAARRGDARSQAHDLMRTPEVRAYLEGEYAVEWDLLVGHWVGWSLPIGQTWTGEMGGPDVRGVLEHLGEFDGLVHLRYRARPTSESIRADTEARVKAAADRVGSEVPDLGAVLEGAWKETTFEVHVDPAGLRPHFARLTHVAQLGPGTERERTEDARRYELDWSRAEGCGSAP